MKKDFFNTKLKSFLYVLIILFIANVMVLKYFDKALTNESCPNGIVSFELAKTPQQTQKVLNSWNTNAKIHAGLSLGIDYLFIFLYSGLLILLYLITITNLKQQNLLIKTGWFFIFLIILAALSDAVENYALINLLLDNFNVFYIKLAYISAITKFFLLTISIIALIFFNIYIVSKKLAGK